MRPKFSFASIVLVLCLLTLSSLLLAQPATQPAEPKDPSAPDGMVFRLPDGRELNLADMQRDGTSFAMVQSDGASTTVEAVDEDGRRITITDDPDEVTVVVTEDGKDPIEYRADSVEKLREEHPEGGELYDKYHPQELNITGVAGGAGAMAQPGVMGQRMMIRMGAGDQLGGPHFPMPIESLNVTCLPGVDQFVQSQIGDGVRVVRVAKDGAGAKLGLQKHDFITAVNGKPVKTAEELGDAVTDAGGAKIQLEVLRAGKPVTLQEQ